MVVCGGGSKKVQVGELVTALTVLPAPSSQQRQSKMNALLFTLSRSVNSHFSNRLTHPLIGSANH